ncbi:hypothetical protein N5K55_21785 [Pseudomonas aeruginosa]|nr:hypothetical protein [Pseudomonas aeruginosa]
MGGQKLLLHGDVVEGAVVVLLRDRQSLDAGRLAIGLTAQGDLGQ